MQQRADWAGAFAGRPRAQPTLELVAPVQTSLSGARAFLGLTDSGDLYWIKAMGNPQGDQILVNERIVAAAAALIGAPVRPTALIAIPGELAGWRYGETELLRAGTAHGSLHLESAQFADRLTYFDRDDNAIRQPALLALWDWCMGEDEQWLYHLDGDQSIWSFDHGLWIGGGFDWTPESLERQVDAPWEWQPLPSGLEPLAFLAVAQRLRSIAAAEILDVVSAVPEEWRVPDRYLEAVAWMLYRRKDHVAARLRQMAASIESRTGG